jgi:hypothetical protein
MVSVHLRFGTLRAGQTPETLAWYGLAFIAYLAAVIWVERTGQYSWRLIWGAAILFRVLLLCTQPSLSDDIYRYLWDGYVANQGISPYAYPIDAPELDYLDIPERTQANNRWMASPYLPAAQMLFAGLARFFPLKAIYFQIAAVIFDLLSGWLIGRLLTAVHLPQRRLLLYLWNPLVIVSAAHGAHVDLWMVFLTLFAVWLAFTSLPFPETWRAGQWLNFWLPPFLLGLATLTKILPILLIPIMFWQWRWRRWLVFGVVTGGLLLSAAFRAGWGLSGPLDGKGLFGALRIYGAQCQFNSGLFHGLEDGLAAAGTTQPNAWAKGIMGLVFLVILIIIWLLARHSRSDKRAVLRLMTAPFMAYLLLTTTVHPWYMIILLAFVPFLPAGPNESLNHHRLKTAVHWLLAAPWLYLSGAIALSYLTYINPLDFREFEQIRQVEWLPVLFLLGMAGLAAAAVQTSTGKKKYL